MPTSDLIFIIGRQRSGTTVFRRLLARHGALDCDEIFHGNLNARHRFYGFVRDRAAQDPAMVHPEHHAFLFRKYIERQREVAAGRKLAMDVKYFGLNLIPQREDVDSRSPFIVSFLQESQAHVVHLVRRNKLRIFVSEEMATMTGRWSAETAGDLVTRKPALEIDVRRAVTAIRTLLQQDRRVGALLDAVPQVERVFYDEMFDAEGHFQPPVRRLAARMMDIPEASSQPDNLKMNPERLRDLVANYDDLARALQGTAHEWMLTDPN
ncbi:hypothetical protein [Falsirhodobacter algicola]|uniref:Sulfotransferase family protein n=1 Tax=Falsirhodobacter algicola TaxID=2692330 RepID=A0A8J8MTK0_9RHOB|nr:hypothetical protein [Falsirhodobacter algicola]QUS36234.1 hypothetical protein GR316_08095 [Falsirhodobacter algicola]